MHLYKLIFQNCQPFAWNTYNEAQGYLFCTRKKCLLIIVNLQRKNDAMMDMGGQKVKRKGIGSLASEYASATSIHGITYIGEAGRHWTERYVLMINDFEASVQK